MDTISSPGPGPGPVPSLLQTSSTTPSQTRDSNPNPPIGDFDYGGDQTSHLTRHCLLQTSSLPKVLSSESEPNLHLMTLLESEEEVLPDLDSIYQVLPAAASSHPRSRSSLTLSTRLLPSQ